MILVTGGAGFIGSVLIKELNERGIQNIILTDRLESDSKWKNLRGLKFDSYIHADEFFSQEHSLIRSKITSICHMGACSSTTEENMDFLMKNNVEYSKKLFLLAIENQIPFIYASSAATYGAGELGYDDQKDISKLRPLNKYGYSKQLFDEWALKQIQHPPLWFGLKFFNVYGPNEYHKASMTSVVYKAFEQIKTDGEAALFKSHRQDFADGQQMRDFVYVKDVAKAMIELYNLKPSTNISGIYNMGTGKARSFVDLVAATFNALKLDTKITFTPMPESIRNQYQYFTEANMSKFKNLLPNFEFSSLESGVTDYVTNHLIKENPYYE